MRVVFLGSDTIALPLLNWLAGSGATQAQVVGVFTQPDRPVGRGQKIQANGIKTWALERGLPVFQPEKLSEESRQQLASLKADLGLVMAYGQILKDDFMATPRLGMLNFHASLLPKFRGASPIQTAVALGEPETGVSLMRIVRELDAGPVADVERVPILPTDTALEVEGKLSAACVPLLERGMRKLGEGTLHFVEQDRAQASFCRKLVKEDGVIDFSQSARAVASRINGLFPWPACTVELLGQPVKIGQAEVLDVASGHAPGTVLPSSSSDLIVACGSGQLRLLRLQRPGGKMLPSSEFLRGFQVPADTQLGSKAHTPLVSENPFPRVKRA
jgi:methionyl-tRNA formyltransferase